MTRPTRVALVAHVVDPHGGGMAAMNAAYVAALAHRFALTIVANEVDEASASRAKVVHVPTPSSPAFARFAVFWLAASWKLRRLRREVDLVWTTGAICAGRVDLVSVHLCQAGLVEAYGGHLTAPGLRGPRRVAAALHRYLALAAERHTVERSRVLGAVSSSLAAELTRLYPGAAVAATPNGAELAACSAVPPRDAADGPLVVAFIGGDWPLRRLDDLLVGVAAATGGGADLELLLAGAGDGASLTRRCRELGIEGRTTYLGEVDGAAGVLERCDVVAIPSPYETFSLVALEAAAAGRPVVGRAVGIVPELVGDGEGGVVVDGDPASFAAALTRLAADRSLLATMGEAARRRSAAFSIEAATSAMADVLEGLGP